MFLYQGVRMVLMVISFEFWKYFSIVVAICDLLPGVEVKSIQRPGTEAIRTQIQPPKPKREITKITNSQIQREHMVNRVEAIFYLPLLLKASGNLF